MFDAAGIAYPDENTMGDDLRGMADATKDGRLALGNAATHLFRLYIPMPSGSATAGGKLHRHQGRAPEAYERCRKMISDGS